MPPGSKELPSLDVMFTLLEQTESWKLHEVVQNLFATPWSCNMCMVHMKPTLPPHYHPHPGEGHRDAHSERHQEAARVWPFASRKGGRCAHRCVYIKTLTLIATPNQPHTGMLCILCHITAPCCLPAPGWVGWRRALPLLHHSLPLTGVVVHKMVCRVREALGGDFSKLVQEAVHALADQDEARLAEFDVVVIDVANWVLDAAHDGICTASAVQVRVHMHMPTFAL